MGVNRHLRLVVDNTRNEIELYRPKEVLDTSEDHEIPLLDVKEELTGNNRRNAWIGWAAITGFVTAWDMSPNETLTSGAERALYSENKVIRNASRATLGYLTLHLMDVWPTKIDPLDGLARLINRHRNSKE